MKKTILIISISVSIILSSFLFMSINEQITYSVDYPDSFETLIIDHNERKKTPDIYYIILDEYAGYDSLVQNFGFDNNKFYDELSNKGFFVFEKSYSNYPNTVLSIPSSLNMQYLNFNEKDKISSNELLSQIRFIEDNNLVMKNLSQNEYYIVSLFAGSEAIGSDEIIDEKLCGDNYYSSHELSRIYPEERLKQKRIEILCSFEEIVHIKDRIKQPIFVYSHFSLPHDPFVFNEFGDLEISHKEKLTHNENKNAYLQQLKFSNTMILKTIDEIQSDKNRNSVIIVQSDHGERTGINWEEPTNDMIRQGLNNLNAIYLSNPSNDAIYEGITPVNSFRVVFNEYFDAEFELLEDRYFWMNSSEPPFKITDVTDIIELTG